MTEFFLPVDAEKKAIGTELLLRRTLELDHVFANEAVFRAGRQYLHYFCSLTPTEQVILSYSNYVSDAERHFFLPDSLLEESSVSI
jgi:hypothetical protein